MTGARTDFGRRLVAEYDAALERQTGRQTQAHMGGVPTPEPDGGLQLAPDFDGGVRTSAPPSKSPDQWLKGQLEQHLYGGRVHR